MHRTASVIPGPSGFQDPSGRGPSKRGHVRRPAQAVGVRFEFAEDIEARIDSMSPGDRMRALKLLREFRERRIANPIEAYDPHARQVEYHATIGTKRRMFAGGNRSGKTTGGILDDLIQMAPRELVPDHLAPYKRFDCPCYIRVCTPDFKNTLLPVVIPKLREWTPNAMLRDGEFDKSFDKSNWCMRFDCGCRMDFQTYEQTLDKFGGAALHRVHFDEEPPEDIYKECAMRVLDFDGDLCFTMTPLQGMSWTFDGIWGNRHKEGYAVIVCDMDENPYLSAAGRAAALADLTSEEIDARKRGLFVHFGGLVYNTASWHSRIVDPPSREFVNDCEVVESIDPGIRVTGVTWHAFDRDNRQFLFAELRLENHTVADVAAKMKQVRAGWGFKVVDDRRLLTVIDPSARSRSPITATTIETEFANHEIFPSHAQNELEAGVFLVRRRLANEQLFISRDCPLVTWEAERYRIQEREDGKFDVVKKDDHLMDTVRYAAMTRPWDPKPKPAFDPFDPDVATPPPGRGRRRRRR